jgi:hypothetical protein
MIYVHQVPSGKLHKKVWTVYAPQFNDEKIAIETIAKYVHTEVRPKTEQKNATFTMAFMPESWTMSDDTEWQNTSYVIVTKDDEKLLESLPDMIKIDEKMTLFVIPNHIPENRNDFVADSSRIFTILTIVAFLIAWVMANFVYQ